MEDGTGMFIASKVVDFSGLFYAQDGKLFKLSLTLNAWKKIECNSLCEREGLKGILQVS